MSLRPTVSVVIPTYNYGRFVCAAVESALAQTCQALEIIVVDDGSTDDTGEVMARYARNSKVQYVYQNNRGLSGARNTGIRLTRGEFVALLDSDDVWHPEKLQRQVEFYERRPEAVLLGQEISA